MLDELDWGYKGSSFCHTPPKKAKSAACSLEFHNFLAAASFTLSKNIKLLLTLILNFDPIFHLKKCMKNVKLLRIKRLRIDVISF